MHYSELRLHLNSAFEILCFFVVMHGVSNYLFELDVLYIIHINIYIYMYMYVNLNLYINVCIYVYIYIYIYVPLVFKQSRFHNTSRRALFGQLHGVSA